VCVYTLWERRISQLALANAAINNKNIKERAWPGRDAGMQSEETCAVMNGRLGELTWPREGQRENKTLQNTHVPVKIKIMALPAALLLAA
jgi:hypothetical protein